MKQNEYPVNREVPELTTTALLQNVALCAQLMQYAINRPAHLPGIVAFYGYSGLGKSIAAAYVAIKFRAYYVECKSAWNRRAILEAILKEMGIKPETLVYKMVDQVAEQLSKSRRPLIIDETDHIVHKKIIEIIRDIYEGSNAPILLIGEEQLPTRLAKWERFHNRVLKWEPAQPADLSDAKQLAQLYSPSVKISDDLLAKIIRTSRNQVRRICVNIHLASTEAINMGLDSIDAKTWGDRELYTGEAPIRVS